MRNLRLRKAGNSRRTIASLVIMLSMSGAGILAPSKAQANQLNCSEVFGPEEDAQMEFQTESERVQRTPELTRVSISSEGVEELILITRRGEKVSVRRRGNDSATSTILFLNGIDRDMSQWSKVISTLASSDSIHALVQIDLLGQGATSENSVAHPTSIAYERQIDILEDLRSVLAPESGAKITIVGHSYGGGIATKFAELHPELVHRLILIAPYVDKLEEYQPGAGPILMWSKSWFEMFGAGKMYRDFFHMGNEAWMTASWPAYRVIKGSSAKLTDVIALTRGIEPLQMSVSIHNLKNTRVDMVIGTFDEVIPNVAHRLLYKQVPVASRGELDVLTVSHEMVDILPDQIAKIIQEGWTK